MNRVTPGLQLVLHEGFVARCCGVVVGFHAARLFDKQYALRTVGYVSTSNNEYSFANQPNA